MACVAFLLLLLAVAAGACLCPPEAPGYVLTTVQNEPQATPAPVDNGKPRSFSKRGIAYNDVQMANVFSNNCPDCGWAYNWAFVSGGIDSRLQYIPMLWGDREEFTGGWDSAAAAAISNGCPALFSFNEPDLATEANMEPLHAVEKHIQYMKNYAGRVLIGSPAVTNSNKTRQGISWLTEFLAACELRPGECVVDFCNVHWYSEVAYSEDLFEHLRKAHDLCKNRPIWLTEFAAKGTVAQIGEFMSSTVPRLEALDYLQAYSYFMVAQGLLMQSSSELSSYGLVYASAAS